eukprot:Lithocolla_globosa_v1_NODE_6920_length_1015_cov_6.839583.p2 type:complete len:219 gc:universal NODE_6920_length_1015_cov_6.839583:802-146(-)
MHSLSVGYNVVVWQITSGQNGGRELGFQNRKQLRWENRRVLIRVVVCLLCLFLCVFLCLFRLLEGLWRGKENWQIRLEWDHVDQVFGDFLFQDLVLLGIISILSLRRRGLHCHALLLNDAEVFFVLLVFRIAVVVIFFKCFSFDCLSPLCCFCNLFLALDHFLEQIVVFSLKSEGVESRSVQFCAGLGIDKMKSFQGGHKTILGVLVCCLVAVAERML